MKKYELTIEWEIHDTRNATGSFRTGTSKLLVECKSSKEAMNHAIDFARSIPSWELERNNIDVEEYREYPNCSYFYFTQISKVLSMKVVK